MGHHHAGMTSNPLVRNRGLSGTSSALRIGFTAHADQLRGVQAARAHHVKAWWL